MALKFRWIRNLGAITLLAAFLWAPPAWAQLRDSRTRVAESAKFYWISNQDILFEGLNGKEIRLQDGRKIGLTSLYVWNVQTGAIESRGDVAGGLCYADGYVRYRVWRKEEEGVALGDLIVGELNGPLRAAPELLGTRIDGKTCRPATEQPALPEWAEGKAVRRLRPQDGFLVLGDDKQDRNTPVTYHYHGMAQGLLMPFKRREARLAEVSYVPFVGGYFIEGDYFITVNGHPLGGYNRTPWPRDVPIPVWWLYPDGRVIERRLPTEARDGSWTFAAKGGFFYISHRYPTHDGLYRVVSETNVERVVKGSITKYIVSPNGCGIALNHDGAYHGTRGLGTLKVFRVCAGED